jgi:hypothetical protein
MRGTIIASVVIALFCAQRAPTQVKMLNGDEIVAICSAISMLAGKVDMSTLKILLNKKFDDPPKLQASCNAADKDSDNYIAVVCEDRPPGIYEPNGDNVIKFNRNMFDPVKGSYRVHVPTPSTFHGDILLAGLLLHELAHTTQSYQLTVVNGETVGVTQADTNALARGEIDAYEIEKQWIINSGIANTFDGKTRIQACNDWQTHNKGKIK